MSTDAHHNLKTRKTLFASLLALICIALVYIAFQRDKPWVVPEEVKKLKNPIAPSESTLRSEEHTSELQSQSNLVCRLLLEKKKNATCRARPPTPGASKYMAIPAPSALPRRTTSLPLGLAPGTHSAPGTDAHDRRRIYSHQS